MRGELRNSEFGNHEEQLLARPADLKLVPAQKLVIVGLDAADYASTRAFMDSGDLPTLSAIKNESQFSCLKSVIPPNTPPGWTSITTGVNPGKHGIYYFYNFSTSPPTIVNATDSATPRIWDYVRAAQGRSVVVNVPVTYPVSDFSGSIVSGIPPWYIDEGSVYPSDLLEKLKVQGYEIDTPLGRALESQPDELEGRLVRTEEKRVRAFLDLLKAEGEEWLFGMIVLTALDRLQHKTVGKGEKEREAVKRGYHEIDGLVGRIINSLGNGVNVLVVSDHGFNFTPVAFYPNTWLHQRGLLKRKSATSFQISKALHDLFDGRFLWIPQSLTKRFQGAVAVVQSIEGVDLVNSRAFVPGTDGLIIVKSKDDIQSIASALSELKDASGKKVCSIYPKDEVYKGDKLSSAPELLIVPRDDVNIRSDPYSKDIISTSGNFPRGNHSPNGIFFASGPGIKKSAGLDISLEDVAPTSLALMGIRPPDFMDGRIASEIMAQPRSFESLEQVYVTRKDLTYKFSEVEEKLVMDNLRRLGYT